MGAESLKGWNIDGRIRKQYIKIRWFQVFSELSCEGTSRPNFTEFTYFPVLVLSHSPPRRIIKLSCWNKFPWYILKRVKKNISYLQFKFQWQFIYASKVCIGLFSIISTVIITFCTKGWTSFFLIFLLASLFLSE